MSATETVGRWLRLALLALVLAALTPAFYYYGTTWIRGPVLIEVEDVYPVGNKGTLEARVAFPDGDVHRVLNRDQPVLFWKIDSERVDNRLSTARRAGAPVEAWLSGVYFPWFGDTWLFNHMNVVAVDPLLPPGLVPLLVYALLLGTLLFWLRRGVGRVAATVRRWTGHEGDGAERQGA